jgi:PHD/YefM family antitoxin component YafN of YafNO toxin-antitoxin module
VAVEMTIVEARRKLTQLPEQFGENPDEQAVEVTRHGKPVLAIMPWESYEAIRETLEIMGDPELMAAFRQGVEELRLGKGIPLEDIEAELGS